MKTSKSMLKWGALALAVLALIGGCSNSPTTSSNFGELRLRLVDAPAAFQQVNIVVTKVEVHLAGADSGSGWTTVVDTTATFDLLTLQNGANAILGDKQLAVGQYTQIRLIIGAGSNVMVGGVTYPLQIPSGMQTGIKLNNTFNITAGQLYELTLDFNADKSIHLTGSNTYILNPVIRVEATVISGTISGVISPASAKATVSAINGLDTVSTMADTLTGAFKVMALLAGTYDVAIVPSDTLYVDTTVANVAVVAQQNTNMGTITLRHK